jgi:hypothetical protein
MTFFARDVNITLPSESNHEHWSHEGPAFRNVVVALPFTKVNLPIKSLDHPLHTPIRVHGFIVGAIVVEFPFSKIIAQSKDNCF